MISLARKNLLADKIRLFISVGGVALSVLLILIMVSLYKGWEQRISLFIDQSRADFWVAQEGTPDFFRSISLLPESLLEKVAGVEGVQEVAGLIGRQVTVKNRDDARMYIFGYEVEKSLGGPLEIFEGATEPQEGEVIIDRVFAQRRKANIGDLLMIGDTELRVVGISQGGDMVVNQFAFVTLTTARAMFQMPGFVNFFLVETEEGIADFRGNVRAAIDEVAVDAFSRDVFAANNRKEVNEPFLAILTVLVVIGFVIGATVIGLTIYTATVERSREYGILKAIGASNFYLYRVVFEQALIASLLGFVVGVVLSVLFTYVVPNVVPEFITLLLVYDVLWVFGVVVFMGLFAAYVPTRRIAGIDPAIAFRA